MPDGEGDTREHGVVLVRGGVLTPYSGLGGAFNDLQSALVNGEINHFSHINTLEYQLGERASSVKRILERWVFHPRRVKKFVKTHQASVSLLHIADQEQAHLIPRNSPVPVVIYVHDFFHLRPEKLLLSGKEIEVGETSPGLVRRHDLKKLWKGIERADAIICNTHYTESLCQRFFPSKPLRRVPYPLNVQRFTPPSTLPSPDIVLDATKCHFLMVGSHDPRKRMEFIIDVLRTMKPEELKCIQIHHIGTDKCPYGGQAISEIAASANIDWNHVGSGVDEATLNQYRWFTEALLFPSAAEGFGYPPVESMAAGQPVLASNRPAHNELMPPDTCLDPEDVLAWADAIRVYVDSWRARNGGPRMPDKRLMAHVDFLAPQRFFEGMEGAWLSLLSK